MSRGQSSVHRCPACRLHLTLCICALIPRIETRTRLVLILHQLEEAKTTNTGRLAARCLPNSVVAARGDAKAADELSALWSVPRAHPLLLFPHPAARPLEEWRATAEATGQPTILVVPDGTWRQAAKARARIPGLAELPCAALPAANSSCYRLRHATRPDRLATLEAIARALGILEGPEVERQLGYIFRVMVDRTLWTNGRLAARAVTGGIPAGAQPDDPQGLRLTRPDDDARHD